MLTASSWYAYAWSAAARWVSKWPEPSATSATTSESGTGTGPCSTRRTSGLRLDRSELRRDGLLLQPSFAGRITLLARLEEAAADAKFVFECVVEDAAVKEQVFGRLSNVCGEEVILASCTLHVPIATLSGKVQHADRVLGVRFLYPVYYIPEVELTLGPTTSRSTIDFRHRVPHPHGVNPLLPAADLNPSS